MGVRYWQLELRAKNNQSAAHFRSACQNRRGSVLVETADLDSIGARAGSDRALCPHSRELWAVDGELADELCQLRVGRVPRDRLVWIEEQHSGDVRPNRRVRGIDVDMAGQQGVSEAIPGEDVSAMIDHDRRYAGNGGDQLTDRGPQRASAGTRPSWSSRRGQDPQVFMLSRFEPQRRGQRVDHSVRSAGAGPLLKSRVVADTDPGQFGQLLSAQTWDSPTCDARIDAHRVRSQALAPAAQESTQLVRCCIDHQSIVAPAPGLSLPQTWIPERHSPCDLSNTCSIIDRDGEPRGGL